MEATSETPPDPEPDAPRAEVATPTPKPVAEVPESVTPVENTTVEAPSAPAADAAVPTTRPGAGRGRRTTFVVACAAVLGIAAGAAVGYGVQVDRSPVSLGPLNQPDLAYPAKPLSADHVRPPLPPSEDAGAKAAGDLRRLMVPRPVGAQPAKSFAYGDGWVPAAEYAKFYGAGGYGISILEGTGYRRSAERVWRDGDRVTSISLVQLSPGPVPFAQNTVNGLKYLFAKQEKNRHTAGIKGSPDGFVSVAEFKGGTLSGSSHALGLAARGDVVMEIEVVDLNRPIGMDEIRDLSQKQWERL